MRWFYTKLQGNLEHGLVEAEVLHEMAQKGTLSREDVIWAEDSGSGWALAETLQGLFPEKKEKIALEVKPDAQYAAPVQDQQTAQTQVSPKARRKRKKRRRLFFLFLVCAVAGVVHYREKISERIPEEIKAYLPLPVDEEAIAAMEAAELESAAAVKAKSEEDAGRSRLLGLKTALEAGSLDAAGARQMMDLWFEYDNLGQMPVYLRRLLEAKGGVSDAVYRSVLYSAAVINDEKLVLRAINGYEAGLTAESSSGICLEVATVCGEKISANRAADLLMKFLEKQQEAPLLWLELAAIQLQSGNEKDALNSLKKACDSGNSVIKEAALADKRFDAIRDTSTFRRCTSD